MSRKQAAKTVVKVLDDLKEASTLLDNDYDPTSLQKMSWEALIEGCRRKLVNLRYIQSDEQMESVLRNMQTNIVIVTDAAILTAKTVARFGEQSLDQTFHIRKPAFKRSVHLGRRISRISPQLRLFIADGQFDPDYPATLVKIDPQHLFFVHDGNSDRIDDRATGPRHEVDALCNQPLDGNAVLHRGKIFFHGRAAGPFDNRVRTISSSTQFWSGITNFSEDVILAYEIEK
ncbi:unnamed protein product [Ectocarpus sp. 4 AP-2014]|uniref:EsV-1-9 n=1 Tax=Ectocarpus siliculosus virus 1 (isolate New Zealand/Kaikoura/1988) TaxID=654926 RepID=Q8QNQ0_ESV1K|nr:EsV-1-9 [Ectocarpus siliculosus virus 1]AAK14435.1 EsV-1-9 [Ectocarpus siliculosus virus 1]